MDINQEKEYHTYMAPPFGVLGSLDIPRYALWACELDIVQAYILALAIRLHEYSADGALLTNQDISDHLDRSASWGKIQRSITMLVESGMLIREKRPKMPSLYKPDYAVIHEKVIKSSPWKQKNNRQS